MEYTFAPMIVRIVFFLLLGIVMSVIGFVWSKKAKKSARILISVLAFCVGFGIACPTIYSLLNPQVKTITCTFVDYSKSGDNINPFSWDCELRCDGKPMWIELDALTRNRVLGDIDELESGKMYVVTYESREDLILGIRES